MNKQFEFINRKITDSETTTNYYSEGRTQNRLGNFCQWSKSKRCLEKYGKNSTQQYSGNERNLFVLIDFHKRSKKCNSSLQIDNISSVTYLLKMGGTQNLKMKTISEEIWIS